MQIRAKIYPKTLGDAAVTAFLVCIIPVIYYFELAIVIPTFCGLWNGVYFFHLFMATFIVFNLTGNLVAIVLTDTSIKGHLLVADSGKSWRYCSVCESFAPPRSWHCPTCNTCILKRDHHCMFTSCCIGHFNHRYFMVFVFYMFVATVYSTIYNVQFLNHFVTFKFSWMSIFKIVFPFATLFMEWTLTQVYIALIVIVIIGAVFTGILLWYHLLLILQGRVTHEKPDRLSLYDRGRLENFRLVFGERWHLVWLSPFVESKLPNDGIHWVTTDSTKGK